MNIVHIQGLTMNCETQNSMSRSVSCEIINVSFINKEIFRLDVIWQDNGKSKLAAPKAGQFFMVKPKRSAVFLGRPISMTLWQPAVEDRD